MTRKQAVNWVRAHSDDDDLDNEELEAVFAAIFKRPANDTDREQGLWSHVCAAAVVTTKGTQREVMMGVLKPLLITVAVIVGIALFSLIPFSGDTAWLGLLFVLYFLPSFVGRKKRNFDGILVVNFLLGWTFIGWVVALAWAACPDREK